MSLTLFLSLYKMSLYWWIVHPHTHTDKRPLQKHECWRPHQLYLTQLAHFLAFGHEVIGSDGV